MDLHFDDASLLKYLREELSPAEQAAIDEHLPVCAGRRCAGALERLARAAGLALPRLLATTRDLPEPGEEALPALPQRYEPLGLVGRGGMGLVVRVRDRALNRELALKTLRQPLPEDDSRLQRFRDEAHITAQLQHPGIPPVHELGVLPDGRPFFALKLVRGQTLAARLRARSSPPEGLGEFLRYFEQICEALAYAHNHDVIHRDIKPANVMIGAHGEVQVMDWGLAKKLRRTAPPGTAGATAGEEATVIDPPGRDGGHETRGALGTYAYMAPEQARGRVRLHDERADVFSLGAVLCEILSGQPPYTGPGRTQLREQAEEVSLGPAYERLEGSGAAAELVALAKGCLAEGRDERPRDAAAVWRAVKAYREGEEERRRQAELQAAAERARAERAEEVAWAERRARRRAVAVVTVVLLLLAAAGGGWWWLTERRAADERAVKQALADRAALRKRAFAADRAGEMEAQVRQAQGAADRAVKLAQGGYVSAALRHRAEEALAAAGEDVKQAGKDRALLARLQDVVHPHETYIYQPDEKGRLMARAQSSAEEQFIRAFQRWGLDVAAVAVEQSVARLKARPQSVVREVVAALDEWALHRLQNRPCAGDWRKLHALADQLDGSAPRRQVRRLLAETPLRPSLVTLPLWVKARLQLQEHLRGVDPATAPVLEVISLARVLESFGDAAGAEGRLRAALAAHPDEVVLLVNLGRLLQRLKSPRLGEAIECHRAARALRPDLGLILSLLLSVSKRASEAEKICRNLVQRSADSPEPHLYLGSALLEQKRFGEAEAALRKAIELRPNDPLAYCILGVTLSQQQKPGEAEAAFRKAIKFRPDIPEAYYDLGNALARQKKPGKAEAEYRKAIALRPNYPEAYIGLGYALSQQQKPGGAEAAYRKAIELRANDPLTYGNLGVALLKQDKPEEAEAAYRKVIELRPNDPEAYTGLGYALSRQQKPGEAEAAYRKVIELRPNDPEAYTGLGNALREQQKPGEAEAAYHKAIELRPDYPEGYHYLGVGLVEQKRFGEAEAALRKAIALRPNYPEAYSGLGVALLKQKKSGEAEAALRKAIELRPRYPEAYNNLGLALRERQKPREAEAAFRKALALRPDYPDAYYNLGLALRDQKKLGEAVKAFRHAGRLSPNDSGIHAILKQAERCLVVDGMLPAILEGKVKLETPAERLEVAEFCHGYKDYTLTAVGLYAEAFRADPQLLQNLNRQNRFHAASAAALALGGKGADSTPLFPEECWWLSMQARSWLRGDLASYTRFAQTKDPGLARAIVQRLKGWKQAEALACVRESRSLAGFPEEERREWLQLWADVDALLRRVEPLTRAGK
jgi:serine/threonine-protein kinase